LTIHGCPLTWSCQLPCVPVTRTTLGPAGTGGSVIAGGVVPTWRATDTESMLRMPPGVVSGVGTVNPAIPLG
jgi:hypothetical protein